jgi:hypothetical protein
MSFLLRLLAQSVDAVFDIDVKEAMEKFAKALNSVPGLVTRQSWIESGLVEEKWVPTLSSLKEGEEKFADWKGVVNREMEADIQKLAPALLKVDDHAQIITPEELLDSLDNENDTDV